MTVARVEASQLESAVCSALGDCAHAVLAVSGGLDSMVLLTAASRLPARARRNVLVATFDHGTGKAAGRAAALVAREAFRSGFLCVTGRASTIGTREEEWRRGRWAFLQQVADKRDSSVVTAHNLDDQIETVFMRILRDAGPRGLAGLYAESEIVRPFLNISRDFRRVRQASSRSFRAGSFEWRPKTFAQSDQAGHSAVDREAEPGLS
jgi:tRNA(Ile)-lysidine synthase